MKKTKKRFFGLLGLVLVVVVTIFAAFLPGPGASAVANQVTDNISVRVIGHTPNVKITDPAESGLEFVLPDRDISFDYENVSRAVMIIQYTDKDGVTTTHEIDPSVTDITGTKTVSLNLLDDGFGYGEYTVTIRGYNEDESIYHEDSVSFLFYPVYGEASEDDETETVNLDLTYDGENEDIKKIVVEIYDENGNLVDGIPPIIVTPPDTEVELPFAENGLESGKYEIRITAYGADGEALYEPYSTFIDYKATPVPVPETGALFTKLNMSKSDFLITSVLLFLVVAVVSIIYVSKNKDRRASVRRNRN